MWPYLRPHKERGILVDMEAKPRGRWIVLLILVSVLQACGDGEVLGLFRGVPSLAVAITSPNPGLVITTNRLLVTGTVSDRARLGIAGIFLSLDGGGFNALGTATPWTNQLTGLDLGLHTIRVYARDGLSNCSATNEVTFTYTIGPLVTITTPTNGQSFLTNGFTASGTATDYSGTGLEGVYASLDGGGFVRFTTNSAWSTNFAALADGPHTLRIYARDNNGYYSFTNLVNCTTVLDTWIPTVTITSHSNGQTVTNSSFVLSGSAADVGSGVAAVFLSVDGGGFAAVSGTTAWSTNLSITSNGTHTLRVYATDHLGYHSTTNQISIELADFGQWASARTLIVANGLNLRISTNMGASFYSIFDANRMIVGCAVDRYRNIYVTASNTSSGQGNYGVVRDFAGSVTYSYTTGIFPGICACDDYGHVYSYEYTGVSVGGPWSTDFGSNYGWLDSPPLDQNTIGVCYVAANPRGYVVFGRNNGTLSVRNGWSGSFTTVDPAGNTLGAHQMALTTNMPPTITFIKNGQYLHSSDDAYTQHDVGTYVTALRYQEQRLWFGFPNGTVAWSDNHGRNLTYPGSSGMPAEDVTALAFDADGYIYVGTRYGKLYRSTNGGVNFSELANWGSYISQIYIAD